MALVKCKECGKEISDKVTACPACGFENKLTICPKCHKEMSKTVNVCPHCGFKSSGSLLITVLIIIFLSIYSIKSIYLIYDAFTQFVGNFNQFDDVLAYSWDYLDTIFWEIMINGVLWLTFAYIKTQKTILSVISFICVILSLLIWGVSLITWYRNDVSSFPFIDFIVSLIGNFTMPVMICLFGNLKVRRTKS